MSVDWDGRIRMDPSSEFAMQRLIAVKDRFDIAFACDTDHDRHGIVTPSAGLLPANHAQSVMVDYLFQYRPQWGNHCAVGKTVVSTRVIDLIAARLGRALFDAPVGFKWFASGLFNGSLGFAGEESAGASFLRRDGHVWTTDKDGIAPALLAAEITARRGRDLGSLYKELASEFGSPVASRVEAVATPGQKKKLAALSPQHISALQEPTSPLRSISRCDRSWRGAACVWFAARPSGTEDIYKIYAESFRGAEHLQTILREAQAIVDRAIGE